MTTKSIDKPTMAVSNNSAVGLEIHPVNTYYSLHPKDRRVSSIYKYYNFSITKKNSLIIYDNEDKVFVNELPTNPNLADRYFIFHTPIFKTTPYNTRITLEEDGHKLIFNPSHILGKFVGTLMRLLPKESFNDGLLDIDVHEIVPTMAKNAFLSDTFIGHLESTINYFDTDEDFMWIMNILFIKNKKNLLTLNHEFIINTNIGFVTGILDGMIDLHSYRVNSIVSVPFNVCKDTISDIFTYLDASYVDVRTTESVSYEYIIKLPVELHLRKFSNLPLKAFIKERYVFDDNGFLQLHNDIETAPINKLGSSSRKKIKSLPDNPTLADYVNNGFVYAYPLSWFNIEETRERKDLYDFTMANASSQNLALVGGPFIENSDGDLLNSSILSTIEGVAGSAELSPGNRKYWKRLDDPTQTIGSISDNAIIGIYTGTKE